MSQFGQFFLTAMQSITPDNGGPVRPNPGGNINLFGAHGINTSAGPGPNTISVAINNTITLGDLAPVVGDALTLQTGDVSVVAGNINLPNTNAFGTAGQINFDGVRFISNFGTNNTFVGENSGNTLVTGSGNCGIGSSSLVAITTGGNNTAVGEFAGSSITGGSNNTLLGCGADGAFNTIIGIGSGINYETTESNNILINNEGVVTEHNTIRIGTNGLQTRCYIAGINGVNVGSVPTVVTESGDQLGTAVITAGDGIAVLVDENVIEIEASGSFSGNIYLPNTEADGSAGIVAMGAANNPVTDRFIHNYGTENTFVGRQAGNLTLTSAIINAGIGSQSLFNITTGSENACLGAQSGHKITTGSNNTLLGNNATCGPDGEFNTILGSGSGANYTTNETGNIIINNLGVIGDNNTIRIGDTNITRCFLYGVNGVNHNTANVVTANGNQLGSATITAGVGIAITTPAPNNITVSSLINTTLGVNATPYVVLATDYYIGVDTSTLAITVQLPNAPQAGRVFVVKDATGNANANNITVTTVGGAVLIDGATTYAVNTVYGSVQVLFDGVSYRKIALT
jgi:hypothetical protein